MSQAKVDKYKNEKANRKKTNARNKVKRVIARIVAAAAVIALVGWGGYSGYQYYEKSRPVNCYYADISAVSDYLQGLSTDSEQYDYILIHNIYFTIYMIKLKYLAGYCEVFSVFEESPGSFCDSDTVFAFSSVFELSEFFALESVLSIASSSTLEVY